jgi:NTP pyrophosphatase (non-canonical NTP hydrolase)
MSKQNAGLGFEDSEYAKRYEEKAKAFAEDAQKDANYSVDEAKETVERMKNARTENMRMEVDFPKYVEFVDGMTSRASKSTETWIERIRELQEGGLDVSRLTTAAVGMSAEAGEFQEIVKKMLFQGKPWTEDNKEHLIIELGDIMWYVAQACMALGVGIDDVVWKNTMKLAKRYPSGGFDVSKSENRQAGDR